MRRIATKGEVVKSLILRTFLGFSSLIIPANLRIEPEDAVWELSYCFDGNEISRTTSRPTSVWNMATQGSYSYSAYSNNNTMWSKYIFFAPSNIGYFSITARSTNTNYQIIFYDALYNRTFTYSVPSTNVTWRTKFLVVGKMQMNFTLVWILPEREDQFP